MATKAKARRATPLASRRAMALYGYRSAIELAEAVGYSRQSVAAAITGRKRPGPHLSEALKEARRKYLRRSKAAMEANLRSADAALAALEGGR